MMPLRACLTAVFLTLAALAPAAAQDTRGGMVPDTPVTLADGTQTAAEAVRQGTLLRSWGPDGKPAVVKVTAVRKMNTDSYYLLKTEAGELHATGALRVSLADGKLVRLDTLKAGDRILTAGSLGPGPGAVLSVRVLPATLVAYDLTVEGHRPFVAGGTVVGD